MRRPCSKSSRAKAPDRGSTASIFVSGLLLGYVRLRTQSVYAAICLHSPMNLLATLEAACRPASLMHR